MIELLRAAAEEAPHRVAIASAASVVTYDELVTRAETVAAALRSRGVQRLAVLDPDHATVWALLAACSLAGVESCLYPVAATDETVAELRQRLRHELLVTPRDLPGPGLLRPEELWAGSERDTGPVPDGPRPLLVLTSGTTSGRPRAARHDWSRILRVTRRIHPTPQQRWLLAYAPNQFAGLQMLLHVAAARATLTAGTSFQPRDGLEAMRRFGATHASGTPTFWRFLLAELRTDGEPAPRLEQVTLGGEAVPSAVVRALRKTFPRAHISQLYAATEMGLSISVRDCEVGLPVSVLEESDGEAEFRIVDGELWVRSRSSMLGYYDEEPVPDDGWRASGDLVEVVGDRIHFRGRAIEVINVGGVKVHPLPIEERVAKVPGVALAHAHGRPNALVGQVVALDVVLADGADAESMDAAIREEFAEDPAAHRPRSITFVETLETHGGKLAAGEDTMIDNAPGRVIIVTGGSRGLGAGIVQSFLDSGDRVATCARSQTDEVARWEAEAADRFLFQKVDLADRPSCADFVKAVVERWGRVDVLVNNAGVARDGVIALADDDDVDIVVDLNLKGTLQMTKLVVRRMLSGGRGHIVNVSSIVGLSGYRGLVVYSATKAALDGMTRALARELGSRGITVNSVAPGYLRTEMSHGLDEEQLEQVVRRTPAGRLGEPADIARVVQFLTAPENDYITGQVIVADGGLTA